MELPNAPIPGFIWAHAFDPVTGRCRRLEPTTTPADLFAGTELVWLHLALSDTRVQAFLEQHTHLPADAIATLTSRDAHASLSVSPELISGTLVDFQRGFDEMSSDIGWLHFTLDSRLIVTTRLKPLASIDRARLQLERSSKTTRTMDVMAMLVAEFQRTVMRMVLEINEELNLIEDFVYDNAPRDESGRLAPARRIIVRLHRHLRTELALLRRVGALDDDEMPEGFEAIARKITDRIETVERDVNSLQERARLLHEDIDSRASMQTNRHLYILSLLTAFLMPPTLVTGFFGMNTENLPFAGTEHGTVFAALLIALSALFAWMMLKRARIL